MVKSNFKLVNIIIIMTLFLFCIYPNEWKCAKVVPIHKRGKRNCVDNYPPISIVSIVAKVFERKIYDHPYSFISENRLLTNYQSGAQHRAKI